MQVAEIGTRDMALAYLDGGNGKASIDAIGPTWVGDTAAVQSCRRFDTRLLTLSARLPLWNGCLPLLCGQIAMNGRYTTQLAAGLGLIDETTILLDLWQPGMNAPDLYRSALQSGNFGTLSARRVHDMIAVGFGPRYLVNNAAPALLLKTIKDAIPKGAFQQLLFLYTTTAHISYWLTSYTMSTGTRMERASPP